MPLLLIYFVHRTMIKFVKELPEEFQEKDIFIEGEMNPTPKSIVNAVKARHIDAILDDALIVSESDDTYMTVYNASEELLDLIRKIAMSEGLFVWQPDNAGGEQ